MKREFTKLDVKAKSFGLENALKKSLRGFGARLGSRTGIFLFVVLIVTGLILLSPLILRIGYGNYSFVGGESYFTINVAKDILSGDFKGVVFQERDVSSMVWPGLVALFSFLFSFFGLSVEAVVVLLSFILASVSVFLLYSVLKKLGFESSTGRTLTLILFVISPVSVWLFSSATYALAFFLTLLCLYFVLNKKLFLGIICFTIISAFGIISSLSAFLIVSLFGKKAKWSANAFIVGVIVNIFLFSLFPHFPFRNFTAENFFGLFSAFSYFGVSLFGFLLAIIGMVLTWKVKKRYKLILAANFTFAILFLLSVLNSSFLFFFNFPLVMLASVGILRLAERNWESDLIKNLSFLLLIAGLVFAFVACPIKISSMQPSVSVVESLVWLEGKEDGGVLSIAENGFWIQAIAEKGVLVDSYKARVKPEFRRLAEEALQARDPEHINSLAGFFELKYVYITPDMKAGRVWDREEEGLLFLFKYSLDFRKIYDNEGIEIWEFKWN